MNKDFEQPSLDIVGQHAYHTIKKHLRDFKDMETGGCKAFYSPKEWEDKGEKYGKGCVLIVVYDGGDLRPYFNMDACYEGHHMLCEFLTGMGKDISHLKPYDMYENLRESLRKEGFFVEECTGWYSAVYKA